MASNNAQTPDLASILNTLAGLTKQTSQQPIPSQPPASQHLEQHLSQHSWQPTPDQVSSTPYTQFTTSQPKSLHDSATIIEWSTGLKCVMRTIARNESIVNDIRKMMKTQHDHEQQWWNGRQALVEKQNARLEGKKKLDDVLKAVGGTVASGYSNTNPEEMVRELEVFDMKVHRAQMQMVKEMSSKLRSLGIPFFGTRSDLVRPANRMQHKDLGTSRSNLEKGMIDEQELVKLQRKMLEILEGLCSE